VPHKSLKDKMIFSRVNSHIRNFSWSRCLVYPLSEDRVRFCNILFGSHIEIENCKRDFCSSCCHLTVDATNIEHYYLCSKQCTFIEVGSKTNSWKSCVEPTNPQNSVYQYCDQNFKNDFFSRSRCKIDMCNLCCISYDEIGGSAVTDDVVKECYSTCTKSKIIIIKIFLI
jgi:hypothetical protein